MSCPKGSEAEPFGPVMSPDDSGKSVLVGALTRREEFYFFKKVTPGQEDYRIYRLDFELRGIGVQVSHSISAGTIPIFTPR